MMLTHVWHSQVHQVRRRSVTRALRGVMHWVTGTEAPPFEDAVSVWRFKEDFYVRRLFWNLAPSVEATMTCAMVAPKSPALELFAFPTPISQGDMTANLVIRAGFELRMTARVRLGEWDTTNVMLGIAGGTV